MENYKEMLNMGLFTERSRKFNHVLAIQYKPECPICDKFAPYSGIIDNGDCLENQYFFICDDCLEPIKFSGSEIKQKWLSKKGYFGAMPRI